MAKHYRYPMVVYIILCWLCASGQQSDVNCLRNTYTQEIGVRENGHNAGDRVEMYLNAAGAVKGSAWCAAFVAWCHARCGFSFPASPAWSPSWFPQSKVIYCRTAGDNILNAQPGDVFGLFYKSKGRIAHVGFIDSVTIDWIYTVEGNTNEAGSREGDGVYRKRRPAKTVYKIARWHED